MNPFSIERDGAFRNDGMEREKVKLHTRYISYVQELNLNISALSSVFFKNKAPAATPCRLTPKYSYQVGAYHANGINSDMKDSPQIS